MGSDVGRSPTIAGRSLALILLIANHTVSADGLETGLLPEPLTLEYALSLADAYHPELELAQAELESARAGRQLAESQFKPRLSLKGALRAVEPSSRAKEVDDTHNDSWVKLSLTQNLYDFGRTGAAVDAAFAEEKGREWDFIDARQRRRLAIMEGFFKVLLADLQFARDTEVMATEFVEFDRAKSRNELGRLSDVELLRFEARYQKALKQRQIAQTRQRATRSSLANALNRPGQLPGTLSMPELAWAERDQIELEQLVDDAISGNPILKALRARVEAAENQVRLARAQRNPLVMGELQAAAYNRETLTTDPFSAALVVEVPIFQGGEIAAGVAKEQALLRERRAELAMQELDIRQAILEIWLRIQNLKVRAKELAILGESRDLDLDLNRSLYELEVKADLGDAMAQISDYQLLTTETEFELALAWARLDALTGRLLDNLPASSVNTSANQSGNVFLR